MTEIPLIMGAVGILLAIMVPKLPGMAGKVLVVVGALVWIVGFYYLIVVPGWQPGNSSRFHRPWNLIVFLGIAVTLSLAACVYLLLE